MRQPTELTVVSGPRCAGTVRGGAWHIEMNRAAVSSRMRESRRRQFQPQRWLRGPLPAGHLAESLTRVRCSGPKKRSAPLSCRNVRGPGIALLAHLWQFSLPLSDPTSHPSREVSLDLNVQKLRSRYPSILWLAYQNDSIDLITQRRLSDGCRGPRFDDSERLLGQSRKNGRSRSLSLRRFYRGCCRSHVKLLNLQAHRTHQAVSAPSRVIRPRTETNDQTRGAQSEI